MNQAELIKRAQRQSLWAFGFASLLATALGAIVMAQADVPYLIWLRNPAAWLVAGGVSILLARRGWLETASPLLAVIVVALSLIGPEQEGVHRWLDLGPVQLNAAALILPAAIANFDRVSASIAASCFILVAALLAWQPDISQLAGFAIAAFVLATARFGWIGLVGSAVIAAVAIAVCLSRPDPLDPVAHVEGIIALAYTQSPGLAFLLAISLTAAMLSPLIVWCAHPLGLTAPLALSAYFSAIALAPMFGAYPVPLAGYGLSFVIGGWLGIAAITVRPQKVSNSGRDPN